MLDMKEGVNVKKSKRRQYRPRGKDFDNENITKLKSLFKSFSIGIEKQLSEVEVKNSNAFCVAKTKSCSSVTTAKSSVLLRPSILSATLENQTAESKTAISSQYPCLNKNIHKSGKDDDDVDEAAPTRRQLRSEIVKNVNEKVMAVENEDSEFGNDAFKMVNELQYVSCSKYYMPPTSTSVRSALNFNDDQSNFESICDENTNSLVMDTDDELRLYTSYSQVVGRGCGRRTRQHRSIQLKRRPKKRSCLDSFVEKFECKNTFLTANSLAKHNRTLLHISKVSAQEYLMLKPIQSTIEEYKSFPIPNSQQHNPIKPAKNASEALVLATSNAIKAPRVVLADINLASGCQSNPVDVNKEENSFNATSRLTLNPDERLFFQCCNKLEGAEAPRINVFTYPYQEKLPTPCMNVTSLKYSKNSISLPKKLPAPEPPGFNNLLPAQIVQNSVFRNPQSIRSRFNKMFAMKSTDDRNTPSPTCTPVSQFSAVTKTTTSFKTKAAMKYYENVNLEATTQHELEKKSVTDCNQTESAEIASCSYSHRDNFDGGVMDKHTAAVPELQTTRKNKEARKKSNARRKSRKDISKLPSELDVSLEESEKLIAEGQRKSKRLCGANQPKNLAEMWSSDENEDFLSPKDIMVLIEENEKKESKRNRRNCVNQSDASAEHEIEDNRRNLRSSHISERKNKITAHTSKEDEHDEREKEKVSKTTKKREKSVTPANFVEGKVKYTRNSSTARSSISTRKSNRLKNKKNIPTSTDIAPEAAAATAKTKSQRSKKPQNRRRN